jgi:glycerol-3-phosphate acyltransferase PlsY
VGSLIATGLLPVIIWFHGEPRPTFWLAVALWPVIVFKHRDNIRRLLRREESKV